MKHINLFIGVLTILSLFGCSEGQEDLLVSKLYFESKQVKVEVEDVDTYDCQLISRVSNLVDHNVEVNYMVGGASLVDAYNTKYGTTCLLMPSENYSIENTASTIMKGAIYADPCIITLKNLSTVEEGNTYLIPFTVQGTGINTIDGSDITYIVIKKPVVINKVYQFNGNYLDIQLPSSAQTMGTVTYEALIYTDQFRSLSTIMGNEGILIFRFGDTTIGANQIQVAGSVQFNPIMPFETSKWYHIAFVYDAASGESAIYVNAEKVAGKTAGALTFDLASRFCIGYAYDYDSRRTWPGVMSECRIWTVARTSNQLRENMMSVDPTSPGLLGYWKLNGSDYELRDEVYYVKDQSPNGLDAVSKTGYRGEDGRNPGPSVEPVVVDNKVVIK